MNRSRAERFAWIAAVVGLLGAALGAAFLPATFPHAWLAALTFWLGWPLGCMGLVLVHGLTGGRWGHAIRAPLAAGVGTVWLLPPALIPWLLVMSRLYPWTQPEVAPLLANRFYLNLPFFLARLAVYLVVWLGLAAMIARALRASDPDRALVRLAPAGLILLAITVTYAAIDMTMALDPQFASSVYGLVAIAAMGLLALSVSLLVAALAMPPGEETLNALGGLTMGLLVLWAYLDFVQLLIVWQSDLPREAPWYIARLTGGWSVAAGLVVACHFALPFLALLSPRLQRSRRGLACVAAVLILAEVLRTWWLVLPAAGRGIGPVDVLAMVGLAGLAAAVALRAPVRLVPEREASHV
jgi:hypothetical protein